MPESIGIERHQGAENDQQNLKEHCVFVKPESEGVQHIGANITRMQPCLREGQVACDSAVELRQLQKPSVAARVGLP